MMTWHPIFRYADVGGPGGQACMGNDPTRSRVSYRRTEMCLSSADKLLQFNNFKIKK